MAWGRSGKQTEGAGAAAAAAADTEGTAPAPAPAAAIGRGGEEAGMGGAGAGRGGNGSWLEIKDGDSPRDADGFHRIGPAKSRSTDSDGIELADRNGAAGVRTDGATAASHGLDGPAIEATYRSYKRRWFGVVQLTLLNVIVSWDWLTFSPVPGHAATHFATNETAINWLSTSFLFAFATVTPAVIWALHRGVKLSIMTAAVLVLLGNWIRYGGARAAPGPAGFGLTMFGQILVGFAQPFVLAAPARYSDLWFSRRGRVGATALMTLANPFGAALGQLIVPFWVTKPDEVPMMVLYVSVISSVCAIPSFFIPAAPPTPVGPSGDTPKTNLHASVRILATSLEFWLVLVPFAVYVGFFNSISSLLNQILVPHGFTADEAGIAGAVLILVGLVTSAISSPLLDRTGSFLLAVKINVPVIALGYLLFIFMPGTFASAGVAGPYVVLAVIGAASFSLLPVALEFLVELNHPISPEVTSTIAWASGQIIGAVTIIISDALKEGPEASPPFNMQRALIFHAVLALAVVPLPMCLGLFGRSDKVSLKRMRSDTSGDSQQSGV